MGVGWARFGAAFSACCAAASAACAEPVRPILSNAISAEALWSDDASAWKPGEDWLRWRSSEAQRLTAAGAVDRVQLSLGAVSRAPGGLPIGPATGLDAAEAERFDLTYTRDWPAAVKGKAGGLDFDVTPRAGLGVSGEGGSAQAGAVVRLGPDLEEQVVGEVLSTLGLRTVDAATFGDKGRWYLFAAASGRAVGLNVTRDKEGDWGRRGWSSDPTSVIGDAQVGLGWRKGAVQASFGYLQRDVKAQGLRNVENTKYDDEAVAFSLSIKPGR